MQIFCVDSGHSRGKQRSIFPRRGNLLPSIVLQMGLLSWLRQEVCLEFLTQYTFREWKEKQLSGMKGANCPVFEDTTPLIEHYEIVLMAHLSNLFSSMKKNSTFV